MNLSKLLDLREVDVDCLTLGQYMQPTRRHLKVRTYHLDSLHFRFLLQFDNDVPKVDVDCICRHSALTCDFIVFCIFVTHFYVYANPMAAGGIMFLTCLLASICEIFTD